jgi:redox-sensitive bicupin YhaK (pirin superfamily)
VIKVRPADSIYHKEGGWFDARWHFSFDEYYDPDNMGFGTMRVFNDDRLVPGAIWPMHPHRDVEGLTYVAEPSATRTSAMERLPRRLRAT